MNTFSVVTKRIIKFYNYHAKNNLNTQTRHDYLDYCDFGTIMHTFDYFWKWLSIPASHKFSTMTIVMSQWLVSQENEP